MYGGAFKALNERLSGSAYGSNVIIFITCGEPSDLGLYKDELDVLKRNSSYRQAKRLAFDLVGEGASTECMRVLGEFAGDAANVAERANNHSLINLIRPLLGLTGAAQPQGSAGPDPANTEWIYDLAL
jgi:hypothetical protein